MEERKELFETRGIDLLKVIEEAKANDNTEFAELVEKQLANVQACYEVIAQKHNATGGELWNIDAHYLQGMLK